MPFPRVWSRSAALAIVAFLIVPAADLHRSPVAGVSPGRSAQAAGVPAPVAAAALNALSRRSGHHSSRGTTDVRFILNWLPNVEFAGLWVAEQRGLWLKAGIHMTYVPYSQSVKPETDVPTQGGNTFGFQSGAAIAIARASGVPIRALFTDTQKSIFGLTVLTKSHIARVSDLRGKRVGYQPHELYVPETMLANAGLKTSDWRPIPVLFDINQLLSGQVDAFLTFMTNEPISLQMKGIRAHTFPAADYGFHSYDDVLFTYDKLITGNAGLVGKVVRIVAQGFRYAHTHVAPTAALTTQKYFKASGGASARENLRQQTLELRAFSPFSRDARGQFTGLMTTSMWRNSIATLYKYQLIRTKPDPSTIYTNRFNPYR